MYRILASEASIARGGSDSPPKKRQVCWGGARTQKAQAGFRVCLLEAG